jgi:hypothetical protein
MHIFGWGIILLIPKYLMHQTLIRITLVQELSLWLPVMVVFYLNFYVLIPWLLTRRKFVFYTASLISLIGISFVFIEVFDRYFFEPRFMPPSLYAKGEFRDSAFMPVPKGRYFLIDSGGAGRFDSLRKGPWHEHGPRPFKPGERMKMRMMRREMDFFVLLILAIAVSTSIKITGKWYSNEKERKEMENQKLLAELSFLKSQINPHFFFNTLNSIYSLAIQKSAKTPEAIVKLSELMRYIIYEADKNLVPLKKELEYIRNYVELQKLRLMSNVKVTYNIEGIYNDIRIEPLLFLPFIENAFKYGVDSTKDCEIKIKFVITSENLRFTVENPLVQQSKKQPSDSSGIGLANTKKRLALLYGENHSLKVIQTDETFLIELDLKIREYELHNS